MIYNKADAVGNETGISIFGDVPVNKDKYNLDFTRKFLLKIF